MRFSASCLRIFPPVRSSILLCLFATTAAWIWTHREPWEILATLHGHTGDHVQLALSTDDSRLVTTGSDGTVRIWETDTGNCLHTLSMKAHSPAFFPDNRRVLVFETDTPRVIDTVTGNVVASLTEGNGASPTPTFSPDGTKLALHGRKRVLVWKTSDMSFLSPLPLSSAEWAHVTFSRDSTRVLLEDAYNASGEKRIFDAVDGTLLIALEGDVTPLSDLRTFVRWGEPTPGIHLVSDGHRIHGLEPPPGVVKAKCAPPGGLQVAVLSQDGQLHLYDVATGRRQWNSPPSAATGLGSFSPDGKLLTSLKNNEAHVWDAATGRCLFTLDGHPGPLDAAPFSPGGEHIFTFGTHEIACAWSSATGARLYTLHEDYPGVGIAYIGVDGGYVATTHTNATCPWPRFWDAETGVYLGMPPQWSDFHLRPKGTMMEQYIWEDGHLLLKRLRRPDSWTGFFRWKGGWLAALVMILCVAGVIRNGRLRQPARQTCTES